jgi:hypothetical protein
MVYITDSGERDAEGAVHEVLSEVRRSYPHKERSSDQEVIDFLAVIADDTAFHVVLPWLPEARTIQALTSRLPNATFLCFPARDESQERTDSTLEFLAPEIDQARETNALDLYEATKSLIESP